MRIALVRGLAVLVIIAAIGPTSGMAQRGLPSKILMILTSVDRIPGTTRATGYWAEEFVVPCETFRKAGFDVAAASVKGGVPPVDSASLNASAVGAARARQFADFLTRNKQLLESMPLSKVDVTQYAAVFVVGGHGVMWDLADSEDMHRIARKTLETGRVLAAVCHGPSALVKARAANGDYLIKGSNVTGFSNAEENAAQMSSIVPFSLEDLLTRASGGHYTAGPVWGSHVVESDRLITGQNPASSGETAEAVLRRLELLMAHPDR